MYINTNGIPSKVYSAICVYIMAPFVRSATALYASSDQVAPSPLKELNCKKFNKIYINVPPAGLIFANKHSAA